MKLIITEQETNDIKNLYLKNECAYFNLIEESEFEKKTDLINRLIDGMKNDNIISAAGGAQLRMWGRAIIDHSQDLFGSILEKNLSKKYDKNNFEKIINHYIELKNFYESHLKFKEFDCIKKTLNNLYKIEL